MQIKTTMRYYLVLLERLSLRRHETANAGKDVVKRKMCSGNVLKIWRVLKKLKIGLPYDLEVPFLAIHPKEIKTEF